MTETALIATSVGLADVLHRLALGVEPRDVLTDRPVASPVRVGQEVLTRMRSQAARFDDAWPCLDFETNGTARHKLRHQIGGPKRIKVNADGSAPTITIRIDDGHRRFVPRRFRIPLWTRRELEAADPTPTAAPTGPYVPMASRLLRPYLFPGPAYPLPRGTTAIQGSVVFNGKPVRWPRVFAKLDDIPVGLAHGDENGEFVVVIIGTGATPPPPPDALDLELDIYARRPDTAPQPDPADRLADLAIEDQVRPPPTNSVPDNFVLRGMAIPGGYVKSSTQPSVRVNIGEVHFMRPAHVFSL